MEPGDLEVKHVWGPFPTQAEGNVYGWPFYFRAEGDRWWFNILATIEGMRFTREGQYGGADVMPEKVVRRILNQCAEEFMAFIDAENLWWP